jgi:hypothetical protein
MKNWKYQTAKIGQRSDPSHREEKQGYETEFTLTAYLHYDMRL